MNPDPKRTHQKKEQAKCRVTKCTKKGEFTNGICDKCTNQLNKVGKRKPIAKESNLSFPKALAEAKRAFQLLRRVQEADNKGMVKCVHGRYVHYSKCDGGHYIPAHYKKHCFDPNNVWPQEKNKNMDMHCPVTVKEYRDFLIKKIGIEYVEYLENTYKMTVKYTAFELKEMAKAFNHEAEKIKRLKGI